MKHVSTEHAGQTAKCADRTDQDCVLSELLGYRAHFIKVGSPAASMRGSPVTQGGLDLVVVATPMNADCIRQSVQRGAGVRVSNDDFQRLQIPDHCVLFGPPGIRLWTCGETEWRKLAAQASYDPVEGTMYPLPNHPDLPADLSKADYADLGEVSQGYLPKSEADA